MSTEQKEGPMRAKAIRIPGESLILSPEDEDLRFDGTWSVNYRGYIQSNKWANRNCTLLHRIIGARMMGRPLKPGAAETVDHINLDKLDNRRENLRILPQRHNQHNDYRARAHKKGGLPRGVFLSKEGRFVAKTTGINAAGKHVNIYIGTYGTVEEAVAAYDRYRRTLPGYIPAELRAS